MMPPLLKTRCLFISICYANSLIIIKVHKRGGEGVGSEKALA